MSGTPWWAWIIALAALSVLVGGPIWGALKFSRSGAEHVRHAEVRDAKTLQHHVVQVLRAHPEIVRTCREDRHPWYLLIHSGMLFYAICIFSGADLTNNVKSLGDAPRFTMGTCFLVGSVLVLSGAVLGTRWGRVWIMPSVHHHVTSEVLGDDIELPYRLGMAGMGATGTSSFIYAATSFGSTTGSLGGWLTAMAFTSCLVTIPWFYGRIRTFVRNDALLIAEAKARARAKGIEVDDVDY